MVLQINLPSRVEERIKRGHEAIAKAKAHGKETKTWEEHLANLERQLAAQGKSSGQRIINVNSMNDRNLRVKVKMGAFGFCNCLISHALCSGCGKVKEACVCLEVEVNPKEEITRQYARFLKKINTPLRH